MTHISIDNEIPRDVPYRCDVDHLVREALRYQSGSWRVWIHSTCSQAPNLIQIEGEDGSLYRRLIDGPDSSWRVNLVEALAQIKREIAATGSDPCQLPQPRFSITAAPEEEGRFDGDHMWRVARAARFAAQEALERLQLGRGEDD
jgi:hypothetical protein